MRPFRDQNVTLHRVTRLVSRPYSRPKWSQFRSRDQYRHQNVTLCSTSELSTRQMGNDITNLILGTSSSNIIRVQCLLLHLHLLLNLVRYQSPEFPLVDPPTPPPPLHTSLAGSPTKVTSKLDQHLHPQARLAQLESESDPKSE